MNRLVLIGVAAVVTLGVGLALVTSLQSSRITAHDARIVVATDGESALAYMLVHNAGTASDRLLSVAVPGASSISLHSHDEAAVSDAGPVIDAGSILSLTPEGVHVLLEGLDGSIAPGATVPMSLTFERAGEIAVEATALAAADAPGAESHMHHQHTAGSAGGGEHLHAHDELVEVPDGAEVPTVMVHLSPDPGGGWNLHLMTEHFTFAPERVNGDHVVGEGHAHLYVDGNKLARLYGPWFHIPALPSGDRTLSVSLNANDHRTYGHNGQPVEAAVSVTVE